MPDCYNRLPLYIMNNEIFQLFVYGSLRSGFQSEAYHYLTQYFTLVGPAKVKGKLYDNEGYLVAVATTEEKYITGELYRLKNPAEFSWVIEQIDDYEGLHVEVGETALYNREPVAVYIENIEVVAWIYWYCGDVKNFTQLEESDVMEYLKQRNKR